MKGVIAWNSGTELSGPGDKSNAAPRGVGGGGGGVFRVHLALIITVIFRHNYNVHNSGPCFGVSHKLKVLFGRLLFRCSVAIIEESVIIIHVYIYMYINMSWCTCAYLDVQWMYNICGICAENNIAFTYVNAGPVELKMGVREFS